jgi:anti-sigma factor RsiW
VTAEPPPSSAEGADPKPKGPEAAEAAELPEHEIDDAIIAKVSDYLDGTLAPAERADVAQQIAQDATWRRAHAELTETRNYLSGLRKAHAPSSFAEGVAETIHKRSAGRFFARRTLGDRVPFGALLLVALAGLVVIAYVLWSSSTGSLKVDRDRATPHGSGAVLPRP